MKHAKNGPDPKEEEVKERMENDPFFADLVKIVGAFSNGLNQQNQAISALAEMVYLLKSQVDSIHNHEKE